jgi:hypothetical protein
VLSWGDHVGGAAMWAHRPRMRVGTRWSMVVLPTPLGSYTNTWAKPAGSKMAWVGSASVSGRPRASGNLNQLIHHGSRVRGNNEFFKLRHYPLFHRLCRCSMVFPNRKVCFS